MDIGENVVLRLMEYPTPTVSFDTIMDNYFTSFRLLTQLGVNNIWAAGMLNKDRLHKWNMIRDKQLQKKGTWPLSHSAHQAKKHCNFGSGL